jgi:hypothetical protein
MSTVTRLLAVLALVLTALGVSPTAALAAAPDNDLFTGAKLVSLGFSEILDTSEATTDSDDAQLNAQCGAPATDASVWYALEGTDTTIVVDVSQSDYFSGVLVGVGTQGNLSIVTCGPDSVGFFAAAGTTYYIMAIDDQADGGGNGGLLNISIDEFLFPTVDITVSPHGYVDGRTGVATISGTYTCAHADFIDISIQAQQSAGKRFTIQGSGFFSDFNTCDGTPHPWSATIFPQNGKFAGGKAMSVAFAFSCGPISCSDGYAEQQVLLSGKRK